MPFSTRFLSSLVFAGLLHAGTMAGMCLLIRYFCDPARSGIIYEQPAGVVLQHYVLRAVFSTKQIGIFVPYFMVAFGVMHIPPRWRIYGTTATVLLMLGNLVMIAYRIRLNQMWFQH